MTRNDDKPTKKFVRVQMTGQRATTAERVVAVQRHQPAVRDRQAQPKATLVATPADAGREAGDEPIKRIGAADVEKILGAEATAALERMPRPMRSS